MYPKAYKEWIAIFNDDLLDVWEKERTELQKTAMLLSALQKELRKVQTNVEVEIINIRQQLKHRDSLKEGKLFESPCSAGNKKSPTTNKENEYDSKLDKSTDILEDISNINETESPDLFRNIVSQSPPAESSVIDLSLSDEGVIDDGSPTIKRRRKHHDKSKIHSSLGFDKNSECKKTVNTPSKTVFKKDLIKTNLFKTPAAGSDNDLSVIENTPEITTKKLRTTSRVGAKMSKKKWKCAKANNTLTQMLGRSTKELPTTNKDAAFDDSDETYFDDTKEGTRMGITNLLNYVNDDETTKLKEKSHTMDRVVDETTFCEFNMDSTEEIDEFSKGALFNDTEIATPHDSSQEPKVATPEPEPVVRGKARKQLQGWACEKCKNFYGSMKLSPEELKKKMDECSRHRYKYNPPPETLPGFWDLSIPPENPM